MFPFPDWAFFNKLLAVVSQEVAYLELISGAAFLK